MVQCRVSDSRCAAAGKRLCPVPTGAARAGTRLEKRDAPVSFGYIRCPPWALVLLDRRLFSPRPSRWHPLSSLLFLLPTHDPSPPPLPITFSVSHGMAACRSPVSRARCVLGSPYFPWIRVASPRPTRCASSRCATRSTIGIVLRSTVGAKEGKEGEGLKNTRPFAVWGLVLVGTLFLQQDAHSAEEVFSVFRHVFVFFSAPAAVCAHQGGGGAGMVGEVLISLISWLMIFIPCLPCRRAAGRFLSRFSRVLVFLQDDALFHLFMCRVFALNFSLRFFFGCLICYICTSCMALLLSSPCRNADFGYPRCWTRATVLEGEGKEKYLYNGEDRLIDGYGYVGIFVGDVGGGSACSHNVGGGSALLEGGGGNKCSRATLRGRKKRRRR